MICRFVTHVESVVGSADDCPHQHGLPQGSPAVTATHQVADQEPGAEPGPQQAQVDGTRWNGTQWLMVRHCGTSTAGVSTEQ